MISETNRRHLYSVGVKTKWKKKHIQNTIFCLCDKVPFGFYYFIIVVVILISSNIYCKHLVNSSRLCLVTANSYECLSLVRNDVWSVYYSWYLRATIIGYCVLMIIIYRSRWKVKEMCLKKLCIIGLMVSSLYITS